MICFICVKTVFFQWGPFSKHVQYQPYGLISVFSRAGSAGCRPAPGLCRPAIKKPAGRLNRAEIGLSENVWLISVSLLVTELWPFKVWVKIPVKIQQKSLSVDKNHP